MPKKSLLLLLHAGLVARGGAPKSFSTYPQSVSSIPMGQAEDEIRNKSYDKNRWAKALVDAEGDEQKRRSRYISLRPRQLYAESGGTLETGKGNTASALVAEAAEFDMNGLYKTKLNGNIFHVTRSKQNPRVALRQAGNQLEGVIEPGIGSLSGLQ